MKYPDNIDYQITDLRIIADCLYLFLSDAPIIRDIPVLADCFREGIVGKSLGTKYPT
jgi:hypothetical protein